MLLFSDGSPALRVWSCNAQDSETAKLNYLCIWRREAHKLDSQRYNQTWLRNEPPRTNRFTFSPISREVDWWGLHQQPTSLWLHPLPPTHAGLPNCVHTLGSSSTSPPYQTHTTPTLPVIVFIVSQPLLLLLMTVRVWEGEAIFRFTGPDNGGRPSGVVCVCVPHSRRRVLWPLMLSLIWQVHEWNLLMRTS